MLGKHILVGISWDPLPLFVAWAAQEQGIEHEFVECVPEPSGDTKDMLDSTCKCEVKCSSATFAQLVAMAQARIEHRATSPVDAR